MLTSDGPPLHHATGVRYHIIPLCHSGPICRAGVVYEPGELRKNSSMAAPKVSTNRKGWKAQYSRSSDFGPNSTAVTRVAALLHGSKAAVAASRVAPFAYRCHLWSDWTVSVASHGGTEEFRA